MRCKNNCFICKLKILLSKWCVVKKTRVESGMLKVMITFVEDYRCLKKQHIIQVTTLNI